MKALTHFITLSLSFMFSCNSKQENTHPVSFGPKIVEAHGYVVPKDSIAEPIVIPIDERKLNKNPEEIHKVDFINTNVHPAGIPKVMMAGVPKVNTPGQNGYALPKTVPVIDRSFPAGIPDVVVAKDATTRYHNTQNFSSFGLIHGLNPYIRCMLEDVNGNLWIGTPDGATKYDGKNFTHFTQKEGLSNNFVISILEDKIGNLWFGTYAGGVSKYDGKNFTHYTQKEGLIDNRVTSIIEDKSGNFWFGTLGGVSKYESSKNGKVARFTNFTEKEGLSNNDVTRILEDKNGNLWIGTKSGVSQYDGKSFNNYTKQEGLANNFVSDIMEDRSGNLWLGYKGGLSKYVPPGKGLAASFTHFTMEEGLYNDRIISILEDKNSNLWLGTFGGGIIKYDPPSNGHIGSFTHFGEKDGLSNNKVWSMLEDKNGNLWFGTTGGLNKYNGTLFTHFTEKDRFNNDRISSIMEDKSGNIWIGTTGGGASKFDGKSFTQFADIDLISNVVWCIKEDKSGNIWFGTYDGVSKYEPSKDGKKGTFTHFTVADGLSHNDVKCIMQDKSGNLWFGTTGGGVTKYAVDQEGNKSFTHFTVKQGLGSNFIGCILEDKSGNIWFGTWNEGVTKYSHDQTGGSRVTHFSTKGGLNDNTIDDIKEDKNGNLWFATLSGVSKYEPPKDDQVASFTHFTEKEGLISGTKANSIMEDKSGNLWFGTEGGLFKLENDKVVHTNRSATKKTISTDKTSGNEGIGLNSFFKAYTYEDGLSGIQANSIIEAKDGTIWMASGEMLTAFHSDGETQDIKVPHIVLTGIEIFNENIPWQNLLTSVEEGGLPEEIVKDTSFVLGNGVRVHDFNFDSIRKWSGVPTHLSLAYDNNYLAFNFTGITLQSPKKVKYQYTLEGVDDSWSAINTRSEATYGNLPPGNYIFKVRAGNSNGYWSNELNYPFTIRPPWWLTWWAYSAYGIFFMVIVWRVHVLQKERTIRKEREKSKERELAKAKEIDQLKTSFFTNISHEFRTPLTLIKGPVQDVIEQLINNRNEVDRKKIIDRLKLVQTNSDHLLRLINQLLDLAKLESGNMKIEKSYGDINSFINAIVSSFYSLADQKHLTIQVDLPPVHYEVLFDKDKLETILINLINNAIKFTPSGGSVIVSANINPETQSLNLRVKDTGVGIPYEHRSRIFYRFHQISETHKEVGTGIGLALVKEIVNLLQGTITVNSEHGEGSEFIVIIPIQNISIIQQTPESDGEKIIFTPSKIENGQPSIHHQLDNNSLKPQILIVEDHNDLRAFIMESLGDEFFFFQAENGKIGLDIAIQEIPDLIISDVMMPEMDGITMAGKLKSDIHTSHIPLILLTAKSTEGSKLKGLEKGADDYLTKPFNKQELLLKVRNSINLQMKLRKKLRAELMSTVPKMEILSADEKFMSHVKNEILKRLSDEQFSVEVLAEEIGLSRSQLYRKVIALTGLSVNELIRKLRMQKAAQLLEQKWGPIAQVAYEVGISNLSYFSKIFKEEFGTLPSEYEKQS